MGLASSEEEARDEIPLLFFDPRWRHAISDFLVTEVSDCWELKLDVGKLQPKSQHFVPAVFYVDVNHGLETQVSVSVFADNLPEPITFNAVFRATVEASDVTVEDIEEALKASEEQNW
ncbi:MAG TPA: hypothetical protein VGQ06_06015 [Gemmatimonadales bacterium]|jgi:hypothetical protein|nr:hypothetical protein [Gemmatimonadales bacterium]